MRKFLPLLGIPLVGLPIWLFAQEQHMAFSAPIDCANPAQCVIQNHVDLAAGPKVSDASCSSRTYDEHHGVDFRILDLPRMVAGVSVKAAADGTVINVRDGEYDGAWLAQGRQAVGVRDCGNGVMLKHEEGYETLYCQLKRDSIRVKEGDTVSAGDVIAQVGMSGRAEFPHLHFAVMKDGERIDPFSGREVGSGCGNGSSLWAGRTPAHWTGNRAPMVYKSGFTDRGVDFALVERKLPEAHLGSEAIVFYARAIWLDEGDVQLIQLEGPNGFEPVAMKAEPLEGDKAQVVRFVGRPAEGRFPTGEYRGRYQVLRGGELILDHAQNVYLSQ